jgi:enamine deaminase RidA (YjgF/YER057c/UK114 family)
MTLSDLAILAALAVLCSACENAAPPEPPREKQVFHLNTYEKEFGFTQAVRVGKTVYISASMPVDHEGRLVAPGDMPGQLRAAYANLQLTLAAIGAGFDEIASETLYSTDMDALLKASAVRFEYHDKNNMPATTWVGVQRLADEGFLVAISAVVELP